jgi:hypothetical protein
MADERDARPVRRPRGRCVDEAARPRQAADRAAVGAGHQQARVEHAVARARVTRRETAPVHDSTPVGRPRRIVLPARRVREPSKPRAVRTQREQVGDLVDAWPAFLAHQGTLAYTSCGDGAGAPPACPTTAAAQATAASSVTAPDTQSAYGPTACRPFAAPSSACAGRDARRAVDGEAHARLSAGSAPGRAGLLGRVVVPE